MSKKEAQFKLRSPCWARWTTTEVPQENMKRSWLAAVKMVNAMDPDEVYGYRIQVNAKRAKDKESVPKTGTNVPKKGTGIDAKGEICVRLDSGTRVAINEGKD